ncbi:MurR/RpiR family transcriptional regulator [Rhizobium sp. SYY.PMSO]|uniref:MurR/RpiR family transcriptional regulator n=1 Tax=Rhizobium sp. SYY.PMSO TaxID=3382192 RepID=UPI00398FE732
MDIAKSGAAKLKARIQAARPQLSPAELRAVLYLRDHPQDVLFENVATLGSLSQTSDATVVRAVQTLGYKGISELKRELGRDLITKTAPAERLHSRLERNREHQRDPITAVFDESLARLEQARDSIQLDTIVAAANLLAGAVRVYTWGLGASSHEASYAALRLRRLGIGAYHLASTGFHLGDELLLIGENDVVMIYVRGRRLVDVQVMIDAVVAAGANILLITGALGAAYSQQVSVVLETSDSREGYTREALAASFVTDVLMLALAERDEPRAIQSSQKLSELRGELIGKRASKRKSLATARKEA